MMKTINTKGETQEGLKRIAERMDRYRCVSKDCLHQDFGVIVKGTKTFEKHSYGEDFEYKKIHSILCEKCDGHIIAHINDIDDHLNELSGIQEFTDELLAVQNFLGKERVIKLLNELGYKVQD